MRAVKIRRRSSRSCRMVIGLTPLPQESMKGQRSRLVERSIQRGPRVAARSSGLRGHVLPLMHVLLRSATPNRPFFRVGARDEVQLALPRAGMVAVILFG